MASVIERAVRILTRHGGVVFTAGPQDIRVPALDDTGFDVSLHVAGPSRFLVRYYGWFQTFDRAEDAYDCFEYGLSDSCRLRVTYRGDGQVAWRIEKREYGLWAPGREVKKRLVAFWRPARVAHLQNRAFTSGAGMP